MARQFDRAAPGMLVRWGRVSLAILLAASMPGCVQRRMTIRSNPSGALVYVGNKEIGTTPVSTSYIYYGTREFKLVKDGYETLTETRRIRAPWYQWFPLDFVSENVLPVEIRDERMIDFTLQPQMIAPAQMTIGRAEELRRASHGQAAVPIVAPNPTPTSAPPAIIPEMSGVPVLE
jgi:hypothetical protein